MNVKIQEISLPTHPRIFKSPEEVVKAIKPLISELEEKLNECERQINIIK